MGDVRPIRRREDLAREHFFYFPAKTDAETVASRLHDRVWNTHVALGADHVNWLAFAQEPDPVRDMGELWDELVSLAEQFNGEYDGYGRWLENRTINADCAEE